MSVPGIPTLSAEDVEAIRASGVARANLEKSAQWYFGFLQRNDHWIKPYDHNHLRITRAIKSLHLLVAKDVAKSFLNAIFEISGDVLKVISADAMTSGNRA